MLVSNVESGLRFGDSDDRLGGEVNDRLNLILGQGAFQQLVVLDGATYHVDLREQARCG